MRIGSRNKNASQTRAKLTAGVPGMWECTADAWDGIELEDLEDCYNRPAAITTTQATRDAYLIAVAVWPQLREARSFHQALTVLRNAGCVLQTFTKNEG